MENYDINEDVVTTTIEALYWISKIWSENPHLPKSEKEEATREVLDYLADNFIKDLS